MKKHSSVLIAFIVAALVMSCLPAVYVSAATKAKKMTAYDCIKKKNIVYCTNQGRIFKVNLKTQKVSVLVSSKMYYPGRLKLIGKYLYYANQSQDINSLIYRVNVKTGAKKKLASKAASEYVISRKKIYYKATAFKNNQSYYKKRVMKLNGKAKKATKYKPKQVLKKTNAKGYYVWDDVDWDNYDWSSAGPASYYLHTPDGDILLEQRDWPII